MTNIIDRGALATIFDLARSAAKSPGTLAFIDQHAGTLDALLGALEQQAKQRAQGQAQPPAATPPTPKAPFDPHTPAAQANRDKRRAERLAREAAKGAESESPAE